MSYGIAVYDSDGTTTVLSPSTRFMTRMTDRISISIPAQTNTLIALDMTGITTSNSDIVFESTYNEGTLLITRESGGFRITNDHPSTTHNNTVFVLRY